MKDTLRKLLDIACEGEDLTEDEFNEIDAVLRKIRKARKVNINGKPIESSPNQQKGM